MAQNKDIILLSLMRTRGFQRLPKPLQMIELQDYAYQKKQFKNGTMEVDDADND